MLSYSRNFSVNIEVEMILTCVGNSFSHYRRNVVISEALSV